MDTDFPLHHNWCMMAPRRGWEVVFYEDRRGRRPAEEFIEQLPARDSEKVVAWLDFLEEKGPRLGRPYAARLEAGIYELRVRVSTLRYRILYFFWTGRRIVLTHGFTKKSGPVPRAEIERAKRYREDWLERFGGGA